MNITDEMVVTFDAAYMVCAETHAGGDGDTSERCCIASGIERVAPLIAAQALRDVVGYLSVTHHHLHLHDRMGANLTCDGCRILREIEDPDPCCARPNMVWEHSRDSKDHFRCAGCGGGMTKARVTDA